MYSCHLNNKTYSVFKRRACHTTSGIVSDILTSHKSQIEMIEWLIAHTTILDIHSS